MSVQLCSHVSDYVCFGCTCACFCEVNARVRQIDVSLSVAEMLHMRNQVEQLRAHVQKIAHARSLARAEQPRARTVVSATLCALAREIGLSRTVLAS